MTAPLDTPGVLACCREGLTQAVAVQAMGSYPEWCASALVLSEAVMLRDRLGLDADRADRLRQALRDDWERCAVVPLDRKCLDRAAELGRTQPLRTVDALHLAAADRLPRPVAYLTFDPAQIPVALSLGFSLPEDDLTRS